MTWRVMMTSRYGRRILESVSITLVVLATVMVYHKPALVRSPSGTPMASFILNSGKNAADESVKATTIPKIIHQTWKTDEVPLIFHPWIQSWLDTNADWEYWFWADEDIRDFLQLRYPGYMSLYDSYPASGYRADIFRYFVLYEYGGVYADLDMECRRPISEYLLSLTSSCFLSQEPHAHGHLLSPVGVPLVSNALMGCMPGHPFFSYIIVHLPTTTGVLQWVDVLKSTGPEMLTHVYREYESTSSLFDEDLRTVSIAKPEEFHPVVDESMVDSMRRMCMTRELSWLTFILYPAYGEMHHDVCTHIVGYQFNGKLDSDDAFTNHHWTHTWAGRRYDPWGVHNDAQQSFHIRELLVGYKDPKPENAHPKRKHNKL